MIELERHVSVNKELATVVDYLADFTHTEHWDAGTITCEQIDLGAVRVGTTWRNVSEFRGKRTTLVYTLKRYEPNRLTFAGENKTVSTVDDLSFHAEDGVTHIRYVARFTFHGPAALAQPFLRKPLKGLADDTMKQLAEVLNGVH